MAYFFTATLASRGYYVYKNSSWTNAKVGEKVTVVMETKSSLEVDPYACAIKIKNRFFDSLITVKYHDISPVKYHDMFTFLSKLKAVRLLVMSSL